MTAEIAIMNAKGLALAADSAVTINGGEKVYHSVHKLFELSNQHPVGVMVYGKDKILQVPWETIIKIYRKQLQGQLFDTLEKYTIDFFQFLLNNEYDYLFDKKIEDHFIFGSLENEIINISETFCQMKQTIAHRLEQLNDTEQLEEQYLKQGEKRLLKYLHALEEREYIGEFDDEDFDAIFQLYGPYIERMLNERYDRNILKESWTDLIKKVACHVVLKKFTDNQSGIVFAGFGDKEIFPSVISFRVEGKINGKFKYEMSTERTKSIDGSSGAAIVPFAQVDTVTAFITGMDRKMEDFSLTQLEEMFELLPSKLMDQLKENLKEERDIEKVQEKIYDELISMYREFNESIYAYKREKYIDPLMDTVQSLPDKELAEMAETLVHLTSFKRKMSSTVESVGGPIDVAFISKGDGFVWVKRKYNFA